MGVDSWRRKTLGDLVTLQRGHDLPEPERRPGKVPILGSFGVTGWHNIAKAAGPGVTVGRSGASFGAVSYSSEDFWPLNTALYVVDFHGNDARFAYYFLKNIDFSAHNSGSAQPSLNRNFIHPLLAMIPPLGEQRAIAHILGSLDDKIELNRRMNETLEAMARALFQSWFVDFDPVRAKAAGRAPSGMDAETAKLFPKEFVASEMGEIPKGWIATTLGDAVERCGGTIQTGPFGSQLHASDYVEHGIPVVMPKDIGGRSVSTTSIARIREQDAERLSRHRLLPGDIVYSRRADVERHALIGSRERGWLCGTGCLLVRLGSAWRSPSYASFALDRQETRTWISQHAVGATMPNLNTGILADVPMLIPSDTILDAYARLVDPIQAMVTSREEENGTLASLRDTLLPRLLSGELSVKQAEAVVERRM